MAMAVIEHTVKHLTPEEYVAKYGRVDWRCSYSPTGAHHWVGEGTGKSMEWECKYCHAAVHGFGRLWDW